MRGRGEGGVAKNLKGGGEAGQAGQRLRQRDMCLLYEIETRDVACLTKKKHDSDTEMWSSCEENLSQVFGANKRCF